MTQCGLEAYQAGYLRYLEKRQKMCEVRLMFRCFLCDEDYVSKEGLWSHMDLHAIADANKEFHYKEITAKHKLHQCVVCNDQRAYSESSLWKHVHDVHHGFLLRCSNCGENFRSEQLKIDHASSRCKARDRMIASDLNALDLEEIPAPNEVERMTSDAEHLKLSLGVQSSNANEKLKFDAQLSEYSRVSLNTASDADNIIIDNESELPTINSTKSKNLSSQFACDICRISFASKSLLLRHKKAKYSCLEGMQQKCPHCQKKIQIKTYQTHFSLCAKTKFSCGLCPMKFLTSTYLANHKRNVHCRKEVPGSEQKGPIPMKNMMEQTMNSTDHEILVSSPDSSCSSNVVEDRDLSMAEKDITDKSVQLLVENPSSESSSTKCIHCEKECASATNLRNHIVHIHQLTKCSICGMTFEGLRQARYHKVAKHVKPGYECWYECAKCSKIFHHKTSYKLHLNICAPVQSDFSSHMKSGELILKDRDDPKVATAENPSGEASCIKCSHCGINQSSAVDLARHILLHHEPVACDFCGITWSSLFQAQHHMKMVHTRSRVQCPHCSMQFSWRVCLEKHVSKCEREKVPCEFCGTMFEDVTAVTEHKRRTCRAKSLPMVESGFCQTKCYYCDEEFSSPGYLNHHLKISHKLTKCEICGITVIGISFTKYHKIKCQKEPKYECRTCGKKFRTQRECIAHCSFCEHGVHSSKLREAAFREVNSVKSHNMPHHPDESCLEKIQLDQDQKQAQNSDLKMEITAEESTISARDDQRLSTVNPSSRVDVSDSRSNEHSSANLDDDDSMDCQVIDKESRRVSVDPLDGSNKRHTLSEEVSQPLVGNLSNEPYSCNICGITLHSYSQIYYHKVTRHTEGKFQCFHCSRKFHFKSRLEEHASCCANLKYSCELCGQKFNLLSRLENHKEQVHDSNRHFRNVNTEGADCTEVQKQHSFYMKDAAQEMTSCIICRISLAGTDDLTKHKLTCPKHTQKHVDSQFGAEEMSLLHELKEAQVNSTIVPQGKYIDLNLEIKVEETMLQDQEYQILNDDPGRLFASTVDP